MSRQVTPFATVGSGIAAGESLGSYTTHGDALRRTPYGGFRWLAGAGASRLLTKGLLLSSEMVPAFLLDLRFFFPGVEVRRGLAAHFSNLPSCLPLLTDPSHSCSFLAGYGAPVCEDPRSLKVFKVVECHLLPPRPRLVCSREAEGA